MDHYVLNTSAVMAVLRDEPQRSVVERVLMEAAADPNSVRIEVPFVVLMEVEYLMIKRGASAQRVEETLDLVESWPITVAESTQLWRRRAAEVKGSNRLSVADAWVASLALLLNATVVHKDPEMDSIRGLRALRL